MTDTLIPIGFLAGICADPADDTPRLVLADWLDEHGDPDRAEFLRVQVRIAEWENRNSSFEPTDLPALRRRERKLTLRHRKEWWGYLPDGVKAATWAGGELVIEASGGQSYHVSRGFVSTVTCSWSQWHGEVCERCEGGGRIDSDLPFHYTEPCPDCLNGRFPGIARHLHWHPGATDECPKCKGTVQVVLETHNRRVKVKCLDCADGRVPRTIPATAQPVTTCLLTDDEPPAGIQFMPDGTFTHPDYPGMRFELTYAARTTRPAATR